MMMTLSPSSTWGVKVGLCLPRRRLATRVARRPTTRPSASISTHFFTPSAGFCEEVVMVILLSVVTLAPREGKRAFLVACIGAGRAARQHENGGPEGTAHVQGGL